jgi:hypothetical protein
MGHPYDVDNATATALIDRLTCHGKATFIQGNKNIQYYNYFCIVSA